MNAPEFVGRAVDRLDPRVLATAPERVLRRAQALLGSDAADTLRRLALFARHGLAYRRLKHDLVDFRVVLALLLARRVGLLEALSGSRLTVSEAAAHCSITNGAAATLLHLLQAQGAVEVVGERYALTGFGEAFLTGRGALTLAPLLDFLSGFAGALDELTGALRSGAPCERLNVLTDEASADAFLQAVNSYMDFAGRELLARVDLPPLRHFIVGSMGVSLSALLLAREPESRVTYGCLPHLVARIPRLRERYRIDSARVDGMHSHSGDPEADRWGGESFDLVVLTKKMVLAPEQRLGERFARKAFTVLRPGGVAVLWEAVHVEGRSSRALAAESFLDLAVSPAAGPLLQGELDRLLRGIGFSSTERVACMGGETTFLVARKPG